jgi:small subunit ribosomal protein S20
MPNTKSALKAERQALVRRDRNRAANTRLRTLAKNFRSTAEKTDVDAEVKTKAASSFHSGLDKAAKSGIIHPNKAARLKSRSAARLKKAAEPAS